MYQPIVLAQTVHKIRYHTRLYRYGIFEPHQRLISPGNHILSVIPLSTDQWFVLKYTCNNLINAVQIEELSRGTVSPE
jgi:hypothetical protein